MNRAERRELTAYARKTLGRKVADIEYPGGESRDSVRLILDDGKRVIATRRPTDERAEHEVHVMRALHKHGANVPRVFGFNGELLLQQDLGTTRLSQTLHDKEMKPRIPELLDAALTSMAGFHEAAAKADLAKGTKIIGDRHEWCLGLASVPEEVGELTGIAPPAYDKEAVASLIAIREPSFVKWDSRPGNALVSPSLQAYWFDWEHSGARNAADDLVWLMGDEFVTHDPDMERDLFDKHLGAFASGGLEGDGLEHYVRTLGCFHSCVRLSLILDYKGDGKWWSLTNCLDGDKVGVTRRCARRLLWRAQNWAEHDSLTAPLILWLKDIEEHVEAM